MRHRVLQTIVAAWVAVLGLTGETSVGSVSSVRSVRLAAAGDAPPTAADFARMQADLARLQQELREQRQLILQLMQMHDALLKYVQMSSGGGASSSGSAIAPPPPLALPGALAPTGKGADATGTAGSGAAGGRGSISGKIRTTGALGEAYVYVDGPKVVASRPPMIEVKQAGRQFVPAVAVVQVGTRVLFPNEDKVFHNVFSPTPGDAFDLGTLKAGDKPNPVVLLKPGHVEVFCNIHSRMRADILVTPNAYWTRVRPDGSFQISGVPVGTQHVVLWGPTLKPVSQRVEVTSAGATATFSADAATQRPHLNKQGGAYESYER
jgi:plastocyanin